MNDNADHLRVIERLRSRATRLRALADTTIDPQIIFIIQHYAEELEAEAARQEGIGLRPGLPGQSG